MQICFLGEDTEVDPVAPIPHSEVHKSSDIMQQLYSNKEQL